MMRTIVVLLLAVYCLAPVAAQDFSASVARGRRFVQDSQTGPVLRSDATAYFFRAGLVGVSFFEPVQNARVQLPGAQNQTLEKQPDGSYLVQASFATEAAGVVAYPAGKYRFSASLNLIGAVAAHANLGALSYPSAPEFLQFSATQSIDASSDFNLSWKPFTATGADDKLQLRIFDSLSGPAIVEELELDPSTTEWNISATTLSASKTYTVQLAYLKLGELSQLDAGEFLPGSSYSISETTILIKTAGGISTTDTTPPLLSTAVPADGGLMARSSDGVIFQFNEPMDTTRNQVVWKATQNGQPLDLPASKFSYFWSGDGKSLICTYNQLGGGWPAGLVVRWELNTTPGAPGNFRDAAGNALAPKSGVFITTGGPDPCASQSSASNSGSAFAFFKEVNYLQNSPGAAVGDPERGAQAFAFITLPASVPVQTIVTLKVPTSNPFAFKLKVLSAPAGAPGFGFRVLQEQFASRTDLDDAYPDGTYQLELRNSSAQTTNSTSLLSSATGYPPTPHVANYAACQSINASADFDLQWDPFAGATTNRESVNLSIYDSGGTLVFHAPDPCKNISLDPAAAGIRIPSGVFQPRGNYTGELQFSRITDSGKEIATISGFGVSALSRITRFSMTTGGGQPPATAPKFTSVSLTAQGKLLLGISCTAGRTLVLESSPGIGSPFSTLLTTNPPTAQLSLELPQSGTAAILRAVHP